MSRLDIKQLKSILINFYTLEATYSAKDTLVSLVDRFVTDKWPRPNTRRRKDSTDTGVDVKMKNEIDGIILAS